jgi:hypothetical protein
VIGARNTAFAVLLVLLFPGCARERPLVWHAEAGYRWRDLANPAGPGPGFTRLEGARTGITFSNTIRDSLVLGNRLLVQGAGVAFGDVDGDGRTDLYFARTDGPGVLYRNRGGWKFEDATVDAGLNAENGFSTGAVLADVDGDSDLDLLLNALGGPNRLLLNDGMGRFSEDSTYPGRSSRSGSTTTALADVDGDGDLDAYTANYKAYTILDSLSPQARAFDQVVRQTGPRAFEVLPPFRKDYRMVPREDLGGVTLVQRADPDFFYLNDGRGGFDRESLVSDRFLDERGRRLPYEPESFGLAARFYDVDSDGDPDLYVANDFEDPDEFWINDGTGRFRLIDRVALRTASNSTMAVDFGDMNRDGAPDMVQVDMLSGDTRRLKTQIPTHTALPKIPGDVEARPQMQRNTLFLNRGDGTFAQMAELAGVTASGWSWSVLFTDVDLDGWEDLLIGTGHPWDLMDADTQERLRNRLSTVDWHRLRWEYPPLRLRNVAFRNRGDLTFEDVSERWGFGVEDDISHGMATADLDDDGDLDVVVNRLNAPAAVFRNDARAARIAVRLAGDAPNTRGIGSRVRVLGGAVPQQEREVTAGGLYLSHSDPQLAFATGAAAEVTLVVDWRDGRRTVVAGAQPGRLYEISQATAGSRFPADSAREASATPPLFEDRSSDLAHVHAETASDDFARQFLLPDVLSQTGPGVTWLDTDRDGDEDLLIPSGRGGELAFFRNDRGRMVRVPTGVFAVSADQTQVLGIPAPHGMVLLLGISNYEAENLAKGLEVPSVLAVAPVGLGGSRPAVVIPGDTAAIGPLALGDYDADGDLDLFVGGRVIPGAYPHSPSSRLFRNDQGRLVPDPEAAPRLARFGMVSAATFADVDGDGDADLVTAREWGPVTIFLNDGGRLSPAPASWGLDALYSRWNGLATGDLDGDGRLDLVATSWGRNTVHQADSTHPLLLYFGRFGLQSGTDRLLGRYDARIDGVAPLNPFARVSHAVPDIARRIRTFAAWANASVDEALGPAAATAQRLGATTFDHLVFFNRGNRFEPVPLPVEAQLAPAFHAGVADFDGDGNEDVFLSQNFFATEIGTPRYDAGRSLLLLGNGRGGLQAMPGQRSGLMIYGEQRGAAHADVDGDGRLDLVVSQNAAATRFFLNRGARPGLRVRLQGPLANPDAIGAQIRVLYGDRAGPVREVQAGTGYWSQSGAVQVFGLSGGPTGVWVRWPGGREQRAAVPPGAREVLVKRE